jgi:hypothetical protein
VTYWGVVALASKKETDIQNRHTALMRTGVKVFRFILHAHPFYLFGSSLSTNGLKKACMFFNFFEKPEDAGRYASSNNGPQAPS